MISHSSFLLFFEISTNFHFNYDDDIQRCRIQIEINVIENCLR